MKKGFQEFGGNTTCVALFGEEDEDIIIFDAGTGIRKLGKELMKKKSKGQQTPIDLSRYPSGIYQLLIDNGDKQWVRKVLKQ